ncbi:MAG: hypothetical protein PHH54_01145 [Candidatus Nanoarchaeia archaeon]|nr:hypothetical protein [Candidatus Nanoarchaeia archaeon]MDD5740570.1 hypothetical protein [Candidatus Nanoarchaeia archaeon]
MARIQARFEIKLFIEGKRKYAYWAEELEPDSLDGKIAHAGYIVRDKSKEFKKAIHYGVGSTPREHYEGLVKIAQQFYPGKDYHVQMTIRKKKIDIPK